MKVVILTHTFPRFTGDTAAPFMDGVASGIAAAGNDVAVLAPYSPAYHEVAGRNYRVVTYRYVYPASLHKLGYSRTLRNDMGMPLIMYALSPLMFVFGTIALFRLVRRERPEVISAHWILPNGLLASLVSLVTGVPLVSTLPGSDVYTARRNPLFGLLARFSARVSAAITSNSPQLLDDLAALGADRRKFSTILYGVDADKFRPDGEGSAQLRRELGLGPEELVVLGVGRLVAKKGFDYLIRAMPAVTTALPSARAVIVGDGDQRAELEALAAELKVRDKVLFTGTIDYSNLSRYYGLADIFILPSVRDEKGNLDDQSVSVVEAMACGKPIITTDFPGYRIVVENGKNGVLVPQKDAEAIARAIVTLGTCEGQRREMGKASRAITLERCTWTSIGKQYTALFSRLVDRPAYSRAFPEILQQTPRLQKARQIAAVLQEAVSNAEQSRCLDIGCSGGVIANHLAGVFSTVIGVDVDREAVTAARRAYNRKALRFAVMSGEELAFPDGTFDLVVCHQVYNFVESPEQLMSEIYRVLKPGGACYFSGRNKYGVIEPQFKVPLLSWLPQGVAARLLRMSGKGRVFYGRNYYSLRGLKKLVGRFRIEDYSRRIIDNPARYGVKPVVGQALIRRLPLRLFWPLVPNYIWVLRK